MSVYFLFKMYCIYDNTISMRYPDYVKNFGSFVPSADKNSV